VWKRGIATDLRNLEILVSEELSSVETCFLFRVQKSVYSVSEELSSVETLSWLKDQLTMSGFRRT